MSVEMPMVPAGNGKHPIPLVVFSANNLAGSTTFYSQLFGWQTHPMSAELTAVVAPAGPTVSLRSNIPDGFPGMVPYIGVSDVEAALARVVAAGGTVERAAWIVPMVGKLARFFSELFGWGMLATMPQYMAFDPGAGVAGVLQSHTPALPALAYIYVTDVGAKFSEIETAGGTRMGEPMRIPGTGCFGYFKDPSGTRMGLIGP